jgi:2,4-dienoyl-CoA reductase-like NADH-dependent reductase (Old Yellow Enzyme family)
LTIVHANFRRSDMPNLFTRMDLRGLHLPNRVWMSAMTRTRAAADNVPTPLMAEYFAQRAAAGLMVTDCAAVSEQGKGIINGPAIWRDDQVAGWRKITLRLGPSISLYGMGDSDPLATFSYVVREIDRRGVGYLTMLEPNKKDLDNGVAIDHVAETFRSMASVPFIAQYRLRQGQGDAGDRER